MNGVRCGYEVIFWLDGWLWTFAFWAASLVQGMDGQSYLEKICILLKAFAGLEMAHLNEKKILKIWVFF